MKKNIALSLLLLASATWVGAQQMLPQANPFQVQAGGYLAAEYAKSEEGGLDPDGTFGNPLAGIVLSGQLASQVSFTTEASFYDGNSFDLNQAWLSFQASQYFNAKLGLFVVPFGQYNENNLPHQMDTVTLPLNIALLFPLTWRDIGVSGSGTVSGLEYTLYLGNGLSEGEYLYDGQQFRDNNRNKGWGGRLNLALGDGLSVGYSYYRGKYDDANSRNRILQAGTAAWTTSDFYIRAEYNHSRSETPEPFADAEGWGYYIQTAMVWKNFRPVASYQVVNYQDSFHGPGFEGPDSPGEGFNIDRTRWAVGAVFMFAQNAYLKLEYDFNREKDIEIKNDAWFVQVAVGF